MKRALSAKNLWERSPRGVRRAAGGLLGLLPLPVLLGRAFRRQRNVVRAAERWSAEQARARQLEGLRRMVRLAYEQTAYYRRTFDAAGFHPDALARLDDIRKLPTTDKTTLGAHLDEMCARPPTGPGVDYVTTGGTGGTPLGFYIGRARSATEYAHLVTAWERAGYRLGTPMAVFRGRVVGPDGRGLRHEYDPLLRHHYYSNFHMTDDNMRRYLDHVAGIGPCVLHVYPSSVAALARFLRRTGQAGPTNIRAILAESETVYPEQRQLAEEVFGCRYFSTYGHTEKVVASAECEHSTDQHVFPSYGHFELLDPGGRPVTTPGQSGEITGTGFINTVVPFIRYRTGDYATYVGEHCSACGRAHVCIREIAGHRTQEVLVAADGSQISWTALNMHDDTFDRVRQVQFFQDTPGRAVLRVVAADGFGEDEQQRMRASLGRKFDNRLEFTLELVDAIPLTGRGKTVYVDQRLPVE
jgi:phenylacetate-CoA ligase